MVVPQSDSVFDRSQCDMEGHATLLAIADALLMARATLAEPSGKLQMRLVSLARDDTRARLLMSTPGAGVLVALTYVVATDDPARFRSSCECQASCRPGAVTNFVYAGPPPSYALGTTGSPTELEGCGANDIGRWLCWPVLSGVAPPGRCGKL